MLFATCIIHSISTRKEKNLPKTEIADGPFGGNGGYVWTDGGGNKVRYRGGFCVSCDVKGVSQKREIGELGHQVCGWVCV
jgi:hypothetical protein